MVKNDNKTMRVGVVMAIIAIITLIALAATFAKYVSAGDGADQARVAKWGVVVTAKSDAFSAFYNDGSVQDTSKDADVASIGGKDVKVVAPGTKGTLLSFAVTGKPEVATKVTIGPKEGSKFLSLENWGGYCPLIFTIDGVAYKQGTVGEEYVTALEDQINGLLTGFTKKFGPNTDLSTALVSHSATWEWELDPSNAIVQTNALDTSLGDAAAKDNPAKIALNLQVTIEQTQEAYE